MHRIKKQQDINKDKWVGIGGHFKENESPEDCLLREVKEETSLTLLDYRLRGVITFISGRYQTEYMFLYTATSFLGEIGDCDEGKLEWIPKDRVDELPIWAGDRIFFRLLNETDRFFSLKLRYEGESLAEAVLDGRPLEI